jgi:hypothetical protein
METTHLDELLTSREAAAILRLSERTLERHRTSGTGSRYIALGGAVRYRRRDLLDWIEKAARQSTSEQAFKTRSTASTASGDVATTAPNRHRTVAKKPQPAGGPVT